MEHTIELNLRELIAVIVRRLWLIVLSAIVFGILSYVYTANFVTPLYKSEITVRVDNSSYGEKEVITNNDLTTAQKLVNSYITVIKKSDFLQKVADGVNAQNEGTDKKKVSAGQISANMTAKAESGTEMFTVTISNDDPYLAADIANVMADMIQSIVPVESVPGSSARVLNKAEVALKPYSPSYAKNITLGSCIGALLIIVILVIQVLMDLHVKGEEDLRRYSQAPVLGYIPHYETTSAATGYEYESALPEGNADSKAVEQ